MFVALFSELDESLITVHILYWTPPITISTSVIAVLLAFNSTVNHTQTHTHTRAHAHWRRSEFWIVRVVSFKMYSQTLFQIILILLRMKCTEVIVVWIFVDHYFVRGTLCVCILFTDSWGSNNLLQVDRTFFSVSK